nr:hypothetical protein [Tanacetum cinerariifolium]
MRSFSSQLYMSFVETFCYLIYILKEFNRIRSSLKLNKEHASLLDDFLSLTMSSLCCLAFRRGEWKNLALIKRIMWRNYQKHQFRNEAFSPLLYWVVHLLA